MKACLIGGIIAIGVIAGVFEALASPRRRDETEEKKKQGEEISETKSTRL